MIKYIALRTHFGPSHHLQNSMNFPNYSMEIMPFLLRVRTDEKKIFFFRNLSAFIGFEEKCHCKTLIFSDRGYM